MNLTINNLTGSTRTYLSGAVSIAGNGSTSVTNTVEQLELATDGSLRSDIYNALASVSDGTNTFGSQDAITYLYEIVQVLGPNSDGSGNLITSTTSGAKQALDVNIETAIPTGANTIGFVNQGTTNTLANAWAEKLTDGTNGPVAVKPSSTTPLGTDASLVVTLSPNSSALSATSGSGTISALNGSVVTVSTGAVTWSLSGTWVGTLTTEAQNGDGQWWNVASLSNQSGLITNSTSINGVLEMNGAGWTQTRIIATAWTSGTVTVTYSSTASTHLLIPYSSNPANMNVTSYLDDGVGNAITSTLINSKQRLDINAASDGTDGATAPFQTTQIGGKDGSGNLQAISTDTTGAVFVTERLPLTGSSPTAVSVGVTSTTIIAANASRRGLVLTNTSTGIISLNISGGSAVSKSGIVLYPGGHWEMDPYTFTTAAIDGISTVAASNVAIQELT